MTPAIPSPEDQLSAIAAIFSAAVRPDPRRSAIVATLTMLDSLAVRIEAVPFHPGLVGLAEEIAATAAALKRCGHVLRGEVR